MSVRLITEVRDHAPPDLTAGERLLLVWIAEQARDEPRRLENGQLIPARTCFPGNEALARWCGVSERGLRQIFDRLARRGMEVRMPQGTDRRGRPIYATKGLRPLLRLPTLGGTPVPPSDALGGTTVPPTEEPPFPLGRNHGAASGGTTVPPTRDVPPDVPRDDPTLSTAAAADDEYAEHDPVNSEAFDRFHQTLVSEFGGSSDGALYDGDFLTFCAVFDAKYGTCSEAELLEDCRAALRALRGDGP